MPGVLSVDLRWRIVTCSTVDGLANARLARRFMVSQRSVRRVMERFHADGDVVRKSRRSRRGRITWLTRDLKEELIKIVVDSPHALLRVRPNTNRCRDGQLLPALGRAAANGGHG